MECSDGPEIKARLLAPSSVPLLQKYVDRFIADPSFLYYHKSSTVVTLREELGLKFANGNACADCVNNTVVKCLILEVLEQAIQERIAEQGM